MTQSGKSNVHIWIFFIFFSLYKTFLIAEDSDTLAQEIQKVRVELANKNGTINSESNLQLLNVSYDPTREFYDEINVMFIQWWKEKTKQTIAIDQSHGGSGKQARSVIFGLPADVVTLALSWDIDQIQKSTAWLPMDWESRLPNKSVPFTSTIVFLVRKGNPKQIHEWSDLTRKGVSVITPNPKTSGGARWNYLAAWAYALSEHPNDEPGAIAFMQKLFHNVPILETGARGASNAFIRRTMGDVLIGWENEAYLALKEFGDDKFEIIYPSKSIEALPPVAWIDHIVKKNKTEDAAKFYLKFLYSTVAQELAAKNFYRPIDSTVFNKYKDRFKKINMMQAVSFGSWEEIQQKHFADGGIFDKIYLPEKPND